MKYIAMIDLKERPVGCNFVGCNGNVAPYPLGSTTEILSAKECFIGKWIPVSERPPEELTPVNITWVNRNPEPYYKDIKDKPFSATGVYYKGGWYWYSSTCEDYLAEYGKCEWDKIDANIEITAWMPLPEAYKS